MLRKSYRFVLQWAFFSLIWSTLFIMVAVMTSQPKPSINRRYGYGNIDLPPNYDPVLEDLNRKVEDLTHELFVIKQKLNQLKFGTDLELLRNIGDRIQRLLNMFDYEDTEEEDPGGSNLERQEPIHVCPEEYHGTLAGYPLYKTGFKAQNCSITSIEWSKLVTVIYNFMDGQNSETVVMNIINQTLVSYPGIKIRMASKLDIQDFKNVQNLNSFENLGHLWNVLLEDIDTPYVFIGRDIHDFDANINFQRMVRELEAENVDLIGGAVRQLNGHWSLNCYQFVAKNYTLKINHGYHISTKDDCLVCDMLHGPFLARSEIFQRLRFDENLLSSELLFLDFFIQAKFDAKMTLFNCPDIMTNVIEMSNISKSLVLPFAQKYEFYYFQFWNNQVMEFNNKELQLFCDKFPGEVLSPACLRELFDAVSAVFDICDQVGAHCQLQEGSLLGAVKLSSILPWERDADIAILSAHFHNFVNYHQKSPIGKLKIFSYPFENGSRLCGGAAVIYTESWSIELNGQHEMFESSKEVRTKIAMGSKWFPVSYNPGLHVRNRYGYHIYKHVQHWLTIGKKNGWQEYGSKPHFLSCSRPGHHACLDQYETDGNIQFQ